MGSCQLWTCVFRFAYIRLCLIMDEIQPQIHASHNTYRFTLNIIQLIVFWNIGNVALGLLGVVCVSKPNDENHNSQHTSGELTTHLWLDDKYIHSRMLSILCVVLCEPRDQLLRTSGSVSDCLPPRGRNDGVHKYEGVKLSCSLRLLIISSGWNLNLDTVFHLSTTLAYMYVGVHCTNESTPLVALTAVSP